MPRVTRIRNDTERSTFQTFVYLAKFQREMFLILQVDKETIRVSDPVTTGS